MTVIYLLMFLLTGGTVAAGRDAQEYITTVNEHGAVLKMRDSTLYLGKDCDAYSPQYGRGRWEWANGGWSVMFSGTEMGFARQDAPIATEKCRS